MHGNSYKGTRKSTDGSWEYDVERSPREMKPHCNCLMSTKSANLQCRSFTEGDRKQIFDEFWKECSWKEKKAMVKGLVDVQAPKDKKHQKNDETRRANSFYFHLKQNGVRKRVCKRLFLNTLCIGEWSVHNWVKERRSEEENANGFDHPLVKESMVRPSRKGLERHLQNKTESAEHRALVAFLNEIPNLESHYCRATTSKKYLEPIWTSKAALHREYQLYCERLKVQALSIKTFHEVFDEMNLGLFHPKKDRCDICCSYEAGNVSEEDYITHRLKKESAREEKAFDKDNAKHVFTVDLQSVLLCPYLQASAIYYKMKLKVHNFTVYDLKTHEGYCYLWHEGEGGLTANDFASILCDFIVKNVAFESGDEIIFYSDGCGYQNRNSILANAFLLLAKEKNITITQKFLAKGHTQMECDSMHSTIERKLRHKEIYVPAEYLSACKSARLKRKPYNITYLTHSFFKDYSSVKIVSSIRPGHKKGDPTVTDLCCIRYHPDMKVEIKTDFKGAWEELPKRQRKSNGSYSLETVKSLYSAPLKIKKDKYLDLQQLKPLIPQDYHTFSDTLHHE